MKYTKEYVIIILILLFIFSAEFITVKITNKLLDRVYKNLGELEEDIKTKKVDESLEKLFKDWEKDEKILSLYMEHSEIEKISTVVRNLKINLETNNYLNVEEEVNEIKFRLDYIRNKQRLNLKNIF